MSGELCWSWCVTRSTDLDYFVQLTLFCILPIYPVNEEDLRSILEIHIIFLPVDDESEVKKNVQVFVLIPLVFPVMAQ